MYGTLSETDNDAANSAHDDSTINEPAASIHFDPSNDIYSYNRQLSQLGNSIPYIETSAKDAINVEYGFLQAIQLWRQLEKRKDERHEKQNGWLVYGLLYCVPYGCIECMQV